MTVPVVPLLEALSSAELFADGDCVESKDQDPEGDVRLVQLADIGDGEYVDKSHRFLTSTKARALRCTFLKAGDVMVARMPDPLGRACIFPGDFRASVTVVDVCIIRPNTRSMDARWLMHCLNAPVCRNQIGGYATGTTRSRIARSNLGKIKIPLPALADQRRIADILDRADGLRAKRRAALALLDTLTQSIFVEMFSGAERRWPSATIGDVASPENSSIRTGPFGSQLLHGEFTQSGVAVLGIDNAVDNQFRWAGRRYISDRKYTSLKRYTVNPGDVIITIMGTCGRCAIVPDDVPLAINTKHLCCITLDRSKCLPEFLHAYFLRHPSARRYLEQKAKGALMAGLNMGVIKAMPVPLVPIPVQQEFARRVAAVDKLKAAHRASLAEMDALFASLQHRAFRGEL